jgi:hypothetical protein
MATLWVNCETKSTGGQFYPLLHKVRHVQPHYLDRGYATHSDILLVSRYLGPDLICDRYSSATLGYSSLSDSDRSQLSEVCLLTDRKQPHAWLSTRIESHRQRQKGDQTLT